jgi:hypothetical protein
MSNKRANPSAEAAVAQIGSRQHGVVDCGFVAYEPIIGA